MCELISQKKHLRRIKLLFSVTPKFLICPPFYIAKGQTVPHMQNPECMSGKIYERKRYNCECPTKIQKQSMDIFRVQGSEWYYE